MTAPPHPSPANRKRPTASAADALAGTRRLLLGLALSFAMAASDLAADDREPQTIIDDTCLLALRGIDRELKQEGFSLRADNWTGLLESNQPLVINSQLFRGHDYLFVLAADPRQSNHRPVTIQVADRTGKILASVTAADGKPAILKFEPPRTGSYLLVLQLDPDNTDEEKPTAALSAFMMAYR